MGCCILIKIESGPFSICSVADSFLSLSASSAPLKGSVTPITEEELQVITNNISDIRRNQSVVFAVTAPPKLGRLVRRMPDNSSRSISTFTQSMV